MACRQRAVAPAEFWPLIKSDVGHQSGRTLVVLRGDHPVRQEPATVFSAPIPTSGTAERLGVASRVFAS